MTLWNQQQFLSVLTINVDQRRNDGKGKKFNAERLNIDSKGTAIMSKEQLEPEDLL